MDTPEKENNTMNPQRKAIEIGSRTLKEITIYPLSMGNQGDLEDLVNEVIVKFFEKEEGEDDMASMVKITSFIMTSIKKNLKKVFGFITDLEGEELNKWSRDITNMQSTQLAVMIFDMNYKDPYEKNLKSLPWMKKLFQLGRQLPSSLVNTLNTESKISTGSPSKKVDLQEDSLISSSRKPRKTT